MFPLLARISNQLATNTCTRNTKTKQCSSQSLYTDTSGLRLLSPADLLLHVLLFSWLVFLFVNLFDSDFLFADFRCLFSPDCVFCTPDCAFRTTCRTKDEAFVVRA